MIDSQMRDEAALWMARSRDPKFSDWDGLTDWLEADPAHNLAYEAAFAGHDLAGAVETSAAGPLLQAASMAPRWRHRRIAAGIAGAAAAAAALFVAILPYGTPTAELVAETRPGEHRVVQLKDGSEIALNGNSRVVLDRANERTARLDRGEAIFTVVHNETRPFTVDVDGTRMVDLGTRFDVVRTSRGSEVAVAEGALLYDPEGAAVRLGAGRALRRNKGSQIVEVSEADPATIGTWRSGHLVYREAPLWRVAEDLARATGTQIDVAPAVANRSFTGAIALTGMRGASLAGRLGPVLDVTVAQRDKGLYLKARAGR